LETDGRDAAILFPMSVGILINNYNNGRWLRACVDSVLAQTRAADEVIVYDDGSTDDSVAILREYGARIHLIEGRHDHTRSGRASQAAGMLGAFVASRAEHLYLLDADDAYMPGHIAAYETAWAARPDVVMVQAPLTRIDPEGLTLGSFYDVKKHRADYYADIYRHHETDYFYLTSSFAFRREFLARVLPAIQGDGLSCANDARLALHAVFSGPILTLSASSTYYRVRPGSLADQHGLRQGRLIERTRLGVRSFNLIARHYHRPPIRLWRNMTYLQQLAREWFPGWISRPFAILKAKRSAKACG
jgi:cellulose synthase/poly-beta-1,6-N-acetylglucosamine synthase-like glycosyltransferase